MRVQTETTTCPWRSLNDQGFFHEVSAHQGPVQSLKVGRGLVVEYSFSNDLLDGAGACESRGVTAWLLLDGLSIPVGVLDATLLTAGEGLEFGLYDACDQVSEALQKLILELARTSRDDLPVVLGQGGFLVINRLEVRAAHRGAGLCKKLVQPICELAHSMFNARLLVLEPFPLQYENCEPDENSQWFSEYWKGLQIDIDRLSSFYSYEFGFMAAGADSTLLIKPLLGTHLSQRIDGWALSTTE